MFKQTQFLNNFKQLAVSKSALTTTKAFKANLTKLIKLGAGNMPAILKAKTHGNKHTEIFLVEGGSAYGPEVISLNYALTKRVTKFLSFKELPEKMPGSFNCNLSHFTLLNDG